MDTSEMLRLGAKAHITNLCAQIAEAVAAVPDTRAFALERLRSALGYVATTKVAHVNGTQAAKLASELVVARKRRAPSHRPAMTDKQKRHMSRIAKKRWAAKRQLGLEGRGMPAKADVVKAAS